MRTLLIAVALASALLACERGEDESEAKPPPPAGREADANELSIEPGVAKAFEIHVAETAAAPLALAAPGRVLDGSALVEVAAALASAQVAADASARDLARTRTLAGDQANASQRELAAAEVADSQARGALAAARARARASFGTSDADRLRELSAGLASGTLAIARIELPPGAAADPRATVRVTVPALGGAPLRARVLGAAGTTEASFQGPAVLVALGPSPPPAGAALEAQIATGPPVAGVWLPESALVFAGGEPQAFVELGAGHFARRALEVAGPLRDGVLVRSGVAPGERVVSRGAAQLLSAQTVSGEVDED